MIFRVTLWPQQGNSTAQDEHSHPRGSTAGRVKSLVDLMLELLQARQGLEVQSLAPAWTQCFFRVT